jgi:hypothetical protein
MIVTLHSKITLVPGIGSSRNSRVEVWSDAELYWVTFTLKNRPVRSRLSNGF